MKPRVVYAGLIVATLLGHASLAQRGGSRSGAPPGGGGRSAPQTAEEATRAANAKQWADVIEKLRANSPQAPLPQIHFPSPNELLLSRLRWAEDPRKEVKAHLDKLWNEAKEPPAQRIALETFWHDAEKPKWVRPAIEEFFRKHTGGMALRSPEEPVESSKRPTVATPAEGKPGDENPSAGGPAGH